MNKVTKCLYCSSDNLSALFHRADDIGILKCSKCHLMMVDQINENLESIYSSEYFEKDNATKSGYTSYFSSPVGGLLGKYAFARLFSEGGNHLDLGCADGSLIEIFSNEGFDSRGLEISKDAVEVANAKGLQVEISRLHKFPKQLPQSDVITAYDLLEHVDKPGYVLKEVYENLKPGGHFVFSTLSVKNNDPSDYWFNNSLEHYAYYNRDSLEYILTDVFGKGSFAFTEIEVNGIREFWGVASKGKATDENSIVKLIEKQSFNTKDPVQSFFLSLFYNQVSKFSVSKDIINTFSRDWTVEQQIVANFFNNYYQGKLEVALNESKKSLHLVPATSSIFWQTLASAQETLANIHLGELEKQSTEEILSLRAQVFKLRDELHTLRNSRVVGRIIKTRDKIGDAAPLVRRAPMKIAYKSKKELAKVLPGYIRRPVMRAIRTVKNKPVRVTLETFSNDRWGSSKPLVSVVVPYYNRADTIDDTISSLAGQSFADFEILIVNDGSTDTESVEKLTTLPNSDHRIKVLHQENQGVAAARNYGIKLAQGKYTVCLDSDDMLEPTYIEKSVILLETDPNISLVTSYMTTFGVKNEEFLHVPYDPLQLFKNNMVITAAMFRREAWLAAGGYKSEIGYEDWEFWLSLSEQGFWGKLIPEFLFKYRVAMQSRYVEDKDIHWNNLKSIRELHPNYRSKIKALLRVRATQRKNVTSESSFINLNEKSAYRDADATKTKVLITIPWMTFGGAETLIYNYCREITDKYDLSFCTGLESDHEWEYKFKEITDSIYHLPNLFDQEVLYPKFVSNYIATRGIKVLHIIHNGFTFSWLPELKKRHPELKVVVTLFNDRVPEYVEGVVKYQEYIDELVTDNSKVAMSLGEKLTEVTKTTVIPNGINCEDDFNPALYDRKTLRSDLNLMDDDLAVFFIGRLSEEKNPDVYVEAARRVLKKKNTEDVKFFMVGDGPMRSKIEQEIKNRPVDINYLGYQSEVARYLAAADVFVLPSSIEGFPLSILEAMAMKVVVVASDVGAVAEVIEDGKEGYVIQPGMPDEIAEKIEYLRANKKKLDSMKVDSRKKVKAKYSNTQLGKNYKSLYSRYI